MKFHYDREHEKYDVSHNVSYNVLLYHMIVCSFLIILQIILKKTLLRQSGVKLKWKVAEPHLHTQVNDYPFLLHEHIYDLDQIETANLSELTQLNSPNFISPKQVGL